MTKIYSFTSDFWYEDKDDYHYVWFWMEENKSFLKAKYRNDLSFENYQVKKLKFYWTYISGEPKVIRCSNIQNQE